jgi:hypothetical protein
MHAACVAGAYTNLVKLQMQQQEADVGQQAEVEEVLASGGKPVSRHSLDRVVSRCVRGGNGPGAMQRAC